jgi:hypothetical protein
VRALVIALALMPLQAWWIFQMEAVSYTTWPTMLSLPLHTLFLLLVLIVLNGLLSRWRSRYALSQGELLTIYVMLAIASAVAGFGFLQALVAWMVVPIGRATPENRWDSLFSSYLPDWLVVGNAEALGSFFNGEASFFASSHTGPWLVPILSWSGFSLALFLAMLALNTLLRRRWIHEERLSFPLVQVPLAMTQRAGRLFQNRLLWIGFGAAVLAGLLNGLHVLFPAMPSFQPNMSAVNDALRVAPWSAMLRPFPPFHPPYAWAIGVSMLMPLEISFSYWFFFWVTKLQQYSVLAWGWDVAPEAPFPHQQSAGALLAIGAYALWSGRRHLGQGLRQAVGSAAGPDDSGEPLSYRWALALLGLSTVALGVFFWAAGGALWVALAFLGLFMTATLALSRLRAELGAPANEIHYAGPHLVLTQVASPAAFSVRSLTVLTVFGWPSQSYGLDPTPLQMEGFKMAERSGLHSRGLAGAMVIAAVVGLVTGFVAVLAPIYHLGADSSELRWEDSLGNAVFAYSQLADWTGGAIIATEQRALALGSGFLFSGLLFAMRSRFLWWPFHPAGYVLAPMWFTHHLWLSVFIAWAVKLLLLRYGGLRTYATALPLFLGLILGDCVIGSIWALVNLFFHVRTFSVWM